MATIGGRIRECRLELGLSVDDLALRLGKNRATVYRYEGDEIENLPLAIIDPLAKALDVAPAYLMGWTDDKGRHDVYSEHFRKRLSEQLDCIDPQQFGGDPAPLSDYRRLQQLAEGSTPLSLKDACEAAEALGCSMSYMLQEIDEDFVRDTKKAPGTDSSEPRDAIEFDIISRIQKMDPAQQSLLLATLKIADEQNQKTPVAAPASIDDTKQ